MRAANSNGVAKIALADEARLAWAGHSARTFEGTACCATGMNGHEGRLKLANTGAAKTISG